MTNEIQPGIFKIAWRSWRKDNAPRIGAALAYYTVFSLAPIALILVGISRLFFKAEVARANLLFQLEKIIGPAGIQIVESILENAGQLTAQSGKIATIIGAIIILIGATAIFRQIHNALATIWKTNIIKRHGKLKSFFIKNLLALIMLIGAGVLLLSSFLLTAILSRIALYTAISPQTAFLWEVLNTLLSFSIIAIVFTITVKSLSHVPIRWRHIWPGALFASLLFTIGKFALGLYLAFSNLGSAYGAAGALIAFLFWVYYSAQIFLYGVELVKALSLTKNS